MARQDAEGVRLERVVERAGSRLLLRPERVEELVAARDLPPVRVVRPADLLNLRFGFRNLALRSGGPGNPRVLKRRVKQRAALLIVEFPSQHITELAFFEGAKGLPAVSTHAPAPGSPKPDPMNPQPDPANPEADVGKEGPDPAPVEPPPVRSLIGGPSRLVFSVGDAVIPYTLEGLLEACSLLDLRVSDAARPRPEPTFILPWWLEEFPWSSVLFSQPKLTSRKARIATDLVSTHRLLQATAELSHRFGPRMAARIVSAGAEPLLLGRVREELLEVGPIRPIPAKERPEPGDPGPERTGIELPWRLIVSPHDGAAFGHSREQVEHDGRVELWHTRLGLRSEGPDGEPLVDERSVQGRTIRALWSRDKEWYPFTTPQNLPAVDGSEDSPAFRMALNANDRLSIVHLTADWTLEGTTAPGKKEYIEPEPADVRRLMLSALGGWLDSHAEWRLRPDEISVEEWRHRAAMARDFEVRVVRAGFLFPFGHRASLVKVTERKFARNEPNTPAYLFQRMFIIVRQQTRTYGSEPLVQEVAASGRQGERIDLQFPFKSVTLTTRVTPLLDEPKHLITGEGQTTGKSAVDTTLKKDWLFFPYVSGVPFAFKALAVDIENNTVEFGVPLLFVGATHNPKLFPMRAIAELYDKDVKDNRTTARLRGQRVAFAPSTEPDDTVLSVESLRFGGDVIRGLGFGQVEPMFAPRVQESQAVVPALAQLAGNASATKLVYGKSYRKAGFEQNNDGQVFLELPDAPALDFNSQSDRSGALVAPSLAVSGLSRLTGPVSGDPELFAAGGLDPQEFFKDFPAKLFGAIDIWELLGDIGLDVGKMPKFVTQSLNLVSVLTGELQRLNQAAAALGAQGGNVEQRALDLLNGIKGVVGPPPEPTDIPSLAPLVSSLAGEIDALVAALPAANLELGIKRSTDALLRRVKRQLDDWGKVAALLEQFASGFKLPEVVTAHLEWRPPIKNWPDGEPPMFKLGAKGGLVLAVDVQAPTQPGRDPSVDVTCALSDFELRLLGDPTFIVLEFEAIEFLMRAGEKPDVAVRFRDPGGIKFEGPLSFVETLRELIPLDGFSDPPSLEVSPQGIEASFSLGLPNIAVGVFSIENISLGADLRVPFIGESIEVGFFFCTREDPFRLTVMMFGGGGFFGITVTPDGVKLLEAAFEFGAAVSLNFGVASGSVSIMAGIYFRMEMQPTEAASLTGYVRVRGEVDVLGLISASIELYLELTYEFPTGKATGRATLKIEVEVLFFSATVEISCEKKFAGANGDPTFAEVLGVGLPGARPWDEYCQAYAEVA